MVDIKYKILIGSIWTEFDEIKGAIPLTYVPVDLSDEILFSVSLRGMSVFSSRPSNISYSKMFSTIPFPEFEFFSMSTVLYETSQERGGFSIHLISILIPQLIIENAWIDLRHIQAIFEKHFLHYSGEPLKDKNRILAELAFEIDQILERKLNIINDGEKIRQHLSKYLDSYLFTSLSLGEQKIIQSRIKTLVILIDRVLEAGDNEQIQRTLERMNFILKQELSDDLVSMFQGSVPNMI